MDEERVSNLTRQVTERTLDGDFEGVFDLAKNIQMTPAQLDSIMEEMLDYLKGKLLEILSTSGAFEGLS